MNRNGLTLMETLIASLLMGMVAMTAAKYMGAVSKFNQRTTRYMQAEADFVALSKNLEKYFRRGTAVSFAQKTGAITSSTVSYSQYNLRCAPLPSCPDGSPALTCDEPCVDSTTKSCGKGCTTTVCNVYQANWTCSASTLPGFDVLGEGAVILSTDLRSCDTFDPATSRAAANATQVRMACCEQGMTQVIKNPETSVDVTISSSCVDTPGLGVELWSNGATLSRQCYPYVESFSAAPVGLDPVSGERIHYYSLRGSEAIPTMGGGMVGDTKPRLEIYQVPGNSGRGFMTTCHGAGNNY